MNNQYQNSPYQSNHPSAMGVPRSSTIVANHEALHHLNASKGWIRFVSVMGYICFAFMLIFTLMMLSFMRYIAGPGAIMFLIMGTMSAITFLLALRMTKYANYIGRTAFSSSPSDLEEAMVQQMKFWRLCGILLCIFSVFVLIGLLTGASSYSRF